MAQNAKPAAAAPVAAAGNPKKKMMMIVGAVLLVAIAGGGGWFLSKPKHDADHVEEVKAAPPKVAIYVALEPFTVNLQRETSDQYLQVGISLKVFEPEIEAKIKTNLPDIRSKILQLLTTKTASELLTAEGKNKLIKEIITLSNASVGIVSAPPPMVIMVDQHGVAVPVNAASAIQIAPVAAALPGHGPAAAVSEKGIVDVLFNSFIIQ